MTEREMLFLDRELIEKIDKVRGDISRSEFLDFCVDSLLEGALSEEVVLIGQKAADKRLISKEVAAAYTTGDEFRLFKQNLGDLLRSFLEFIVSLGLHHDGIRGRGIDDLEYLRFQIRRTFG
jgi:hypothetical protein